MQFVKPIPFTDAVGKIGDRSPIGSVLSSSEWADVPVALRERAFFSSTVESLRFLQRARDGITDFLTSSRETLPNGQIALKVGSRAEFVKQMSAFAIAEGMGPLDPEDAGTIKDITSEKRLSLIFNVQTQQSDDFGYWKQGQDPDVLDAFPAQRFIRVQDVKEPRHAHSEFEGQVRLKSDLKFWLALNRDFGVPWGPWGWGCGHDVEDVDRAETEKLGLLTPGQRVEPVEKDFNEHLEASTRGLDPDLLGKMRDVFGDQIEISSDTVTWRTEAPAPARTRPAAEPEAESATTITRESPVSKRVTIATTAKARAAIEHVLTVIDRVHDDGTLKPITINHHVGRGHHATYFGTGRSIGVRRTGLLNTELAAAHEIGHWIDDVALPGHGFSSENSAALADWRKAVENSQAFRNLKTKPGYQQDRTYQNYVLRWREVWARAYAQYVAARSGDAKLLSQVQAILGGKAGGFWVDSHWTREDFAPLAGAMDKIFKAIGWL